MPVEDAGSNGLSVVERLKLSVSRQELYFFGVVLILLFLDWYTGHGVIDGTIDFLTLRVPYAHALVVMPTKTVIVGNWIRIKKKPNGDQEIEVNLDPEAKIDFKATMKGTRKKEHRHKHEGT